MAYHNMLKKLNKDVEAYLSSLSYDKLVRIKDIYGLFFTELSKLTIKNFEEVNPLENINIGIRKMEDRVEVSGYIKVPKEDKAYSFVNIDITYYGERVYNR